MSILSTTSTPASSLLSSSTVNSGTPGQPTISGLASGLDTDKIITGLLAIQQQRIDNLTANQTHVQQQEAAFKEVESRLLALQSQIAQLSKPQNSVFDVRTVNSSNQNLVTAAASSSAVPGVYSLRVNSLAQAQQLCQLKGIHTVPFPWVLSNPGVSGRMANHDPRHSSCEYPPDPARQL